MSEPTGVPEWLAAEVGLLYLQVKAAERETATLREQLATKEQGKEEKT